MEIEVQETSWKDRLKRIAEREIEQNTGNRRFKKIFERKQNKECLK